MARSPQHSEALVVQHGADVQQKNLIEQQYCNFRLLCRPRHALHATGAAAFVITSVNDVVHNNAGVFQARPNLTFARSMSSCGRWNPLL